MAFAAGCLREGVGQPHGAFLEGAQADHLAEHPARRLVGRPARRLAGCGAACARCWRIHGAGRHVDYEEAHRGCCTGGRGAHCAADRRVGYHVWMPHLPPKDGHTHALDLFQVAVADEIRRCFVPKECLGVEDRIVGGLSPT